MPDIVIAILAILFVLGVAINIHEFGHFIVAKFFGMRVEAYSFFGLGPRLGPCGDVLELRSHGGSSFQNGRGVLRESGS